MSFAYANQMPGISAAVQSVENTFEWGPQTPWMSQGIQLLSTAVDAGSTPTTVLRRGLVLGRITATGLYREYLPANTDGSQFPVGILNDNVDMYDARAGAVANRTAQMRIGGLVKPGSLYGFDENARVQMSSRFTWDDLRQEGSGLDRVIAKTGDYTVLSTDNNTIFTTTGAAGAVNFTLPTLARGLRFRFFNTVDQNMVITGDNNIVALHDAAASTLTFSTSSQKIGACVEVVANEAGTKWLAFVGAGATVTIA